MALVLDVRRDFAEVPVELIDPNPDNPRGPLVRERDKRFGALRESVRAYGILVPLVLREQAGGRFQLVDGERRYNVARALKLAKVPAYIMRGDVDPAVIRRAMFQIHSNWSAWDAAMQCQATDLHGSWLGGHQRTQPFCTSISVCRDAQSWLLRSMNVCVNSCNVSCVDENVNPL